MNTIDKFRIGISTIINIIIYIIIIVIIVCTSIYTLLVIFKDIYEFLLSFANKERGNYKIFEVLESYKDLLLVPINNVKYSINSIKERNIVIFDDEDVNDCQLRKKEKK